jgi:hypothetical protein
MKQEAAEIGNAFDKTLRELRGGFAMSELSERLGEVVAAVRLTGKKGKLRLELEVKPASRGETVCVMVEDEISTKIPKPDRITTIFYADEQNLLQRQDPRQKEFELRTVKAPEVTEPLKEVRAAATA